MLNKLSHTSCFFPINCSYLNIMCWQNRLLHIHYSHHLNTVASTFREGFRWIGVRTRGWSVDFPHSCYCACHSQLSQAVSWLATLLLLRMSLSAQLCLSIRDADFFCALWNEMLLQSFYVFSASKTISYFIHNKLSCILRFLRWLYIFISRISWVLGSISVCDTDSDCF